MANRTQVPDGWRMARLGDVVTMSQGGTPRKKRPEYWGGHIPFVTGADLRDVRVTREHARSFLSEDGLRSGDTVICEPGALLLATRTRVGLAGLATEVMGASQDITRLEPNGEVDPSYLCRVLVRNSRTLQRRARGTTIQGVTREDVASLQILVPPISEQRAIAAVLDAIDAAIERTQSVISATERLRDALLHELLTRGVPGWHTKWRNVPGLGTIPADWQVMRLEDVAEIQTGRAVNRKAARNGSLEVPYLSVANVKDGYLDLGSIKTMHVSNPEIERYRLEYGDVLFTEGGDADKLGRGTVWRGEIDPCLHQNHIFAVRPHADDLIPDFLAAYAASSAGKRYFMGAAKQTTNLASVNSTQLKRMILPFPRLDEQERITEILASTQQVNSALSADFERLMTLKASTADSLLTGCIQAPKLSVTNLGRQS